MKRLEAFTIMEVLIVAILSVLIAGAVFSVIQIFNQQYNDYQKDHETSASLDELFSWLQWDCYKAHQMKLQDGDLYFEYAQKTIHYQFEKNKITRSLTHLEKPLSEIFIVTNKVNGFLKKEEKGIGLVDEVKLSVQLFQKENSFTISKEYSAKELISINAN